jgi:hypothetical protein
MVEVDQSLNGIQVLLYLLRNDPALWFIIGFGLVVLLISIIVDRAVDVPPYSNSDYMF